MIDKIIEHFGSQRALALRLGVSPPAVALWVLLGRIPPRRAIEIERLTQGRFKAADMPTSRREYRHG